MLKLIIIEDEEAHFQLMKRAIKREFPQASIHHYDNADVFFKELSEIDPDVILVDYLIPGMNGLELLELLNRRANLCPVIMITGQGDESIAVKALKAGAWDYLVKTSDFFQLLPSSIEKVVRERKLRDSLHAIEGWFQDLAENTFNWIWEVDRKGAYRYTNAVVEKILGYRPDEIIGRHFTDFLPERYIQESTVFQAINTGKPITGFIKRLVRKDHREIVVEINGVPVFDAFGKVTAYRGIGRDITERKLAEEALRASELFARSTLNALSANIAILDEHGAILSTNESWNVFAQSNGSSVRDYTGTNYLSVCDRAKSIRADEAHAAAAGIRDVIKGIKGEFELEYPCHSPCDRRWFNMRVTRFRDHAPVRVVVAHENVTRRKLAEEALRNSEKELRYLSSKLLSAQEDERKRLAREIHDSLGSSLSAIKISLENTKSQLIKEPAIGSSLDIPIAWTQNAIDEARRIMADLRPSILDDIGLLATLEWLVRQYRTAYPGICIETAIEMDEQDIPEELKIVIFRIVQESMNNIIKYSGAELVGLSLSKTLGGIRLMIDDNGKGFDLDATVSGRRSIRTGLGLSSMRERAELSGGCFEVNTEIGEGTTIRVFWPCRC